MKKYGLLLIIILLFSACDSTEEVSVPEVSPSFESEFGEMFGVDGSIGIIGGKMYEGEGQKWMWHFWGNEDITWKPWEVLAYQPGDEDNKISPIISKDEEFV